MVCNVLLVYPMRIDKYGIVGIWLSTVKIRWILLWIKNNYWTNPVID